ncbi:MAG: hypothetical protein KDK30_01895 [Leptospiraceae bacterium]|nr:hypothetical protein [Leptospiraceae bacterium]MCB1314943.1 hypothetical protein [Leptospiraceae bacterium]MCB1321469.1 hypothetical protein [Leptospiraceae bacterium]
MSAGENRRIPRRRLIQYGLLGGGALFVLGGITRLAPSNQKRLLVFNDWEADVVNAYARAILPAEAGQPDAEDTNVLQRLDEELYFVDASIRDDFKQALLALEFLPLGSGYFSRFTRLSEARRLRFLQSMSATKSDVSRQVVFNIRMVLYLMHYGHSASWNAIGYDGPFGGFPEKPSPMRLYYQKQIGTSG